MEVLYSAVRELLFFTNLHQYVTLFSLNLF